ncbi:MAG: hypothetical protein LRY50_10295 [Geovibrio sp.]|nr:hypothetical protein [Geovibrio sp.]
MSKSNTNKVGALVAFIVSGLFIVIAVWAVFNRQLILDQFAVWNYTPTSAVASLSERTGLSERGRFLFYATQPEISSRDSFNEQCPRQEVGNPILGCYTGDDRIYIYDVTNQQLDGMKEVTAAHEMLHAAWARMSQSERDELGAQLEAVYTASTDDSFKERMAYYERTEPGESHNELHSILGTELAVLPTELEAYYAQYFTDRQVVVGLHAGYSAVYTRLNDRADQLYTEMEALSKSIDTQTAAYTATSTQLSSDIDSFNARAEAGSFASLGQFYAERSALVARSSQLERDRQALNADIEWYNALYAEYQEIASQIDVLNQSVDSYSEIQEAPSV